MAERMPSSCARTDTDATGRSLDCALRLSFVRVSILFPRSRTRIRALRATDEFLQRPGLEGKRLQEPARASKRVAGAAKALSFKEVYGQVGLPVLGARLSPERTEKRVLRETPVYS